MAPTSKKIFLYFKPDPRVFIIDPANLVHDRDPARYGHEHFSYLLIVAELETFLRWLQKYRISVPNLLLDTY